jgi:large subunit ribosomal protein L12
MEYIYAALILHSAGKKIDEAGITSVLKAAGIAPDAARVKALVAALDGVNISEAISKATFTPLATAAAAPAAVAAAEKPAEKPKEAKEEKKKKEEEEVSGMEGLGALFGNV